MVFRHERIKSLAFMYSENRTLKTNQIFKFQRSSKPTYQFSGTVFGGQMLKT